MSDTTDLVSGTNVPAALAGLLAAHSGTVAVGGLPGLEPGVAPDEDALETEADAPAEVLMLRTQQQYALEDLMAGKTYSAAAKTAGVNRRTIHRWVNSDPAFRAAMEAWRRRSLRVTEDCLTQGAEVAAVTLTEAAAKDFRAAALLLKGRGLLPGAPGRHKAGNLPPIEMVIPPGKRRDFQVRLRELILSFREEDARPAAGPVAEIPGPRSKELEPM